MHSGDPGLEIDGHQPFVRVAGGREVGGVDHGELGIEAAVSREVEELLHPARLAWLFSTISLVAIAPVGMVSDVPVEHDDLGVLQISILGGGDIPVSAGG